MKRFLEKGFQVLFFILLSILFLKGEVFQIRTCWFNLTFTSVKNLTFLFFAWWLLLRCRQRQKPYFSLNLLMVLSAGLLTTVFSLYPKTSWYTYGILLIYITWYYSARQALGAMPEIKMVLLLLVIIGAVINVADLLFHYLVQVGSIIEEYPFWKGKNALGLFLVINLCLCGSLLETTFHKNKLYFWLLTVNCLLLILGIALSYSRGAWLAAIVAFIGLLAYKWRRFLWVAVSGLILVIFLGPPLVSKRMNSVFDVNEMNIKNRLAVWNNSVAIVMERPILGMGLGTFTEAYSDRYAEILPVPEEESRMIRHAHNLYLQIVMETGLLGGLVLLWLLVVGLRRAIKNLSRFPSGSEDDQHAWQYGCILAIVCFLFYSLTDCTISWQFMGDSFSHLNMIWLLLWAIILNEK